MPSDEMIVSLCCNYWRNGVFLGRCEGIQVGDISLQSYYVDHFPRLRIEKDKIVLAGKSFPIHGHREWFGNWCWDGVWMRKRDVVKLLRALRKKDWFVIESAPCWFFAWWERGKTAPSEGG